jgi:hypothetical protein
MIPPAVTIASQICNRLGNSTPETQAAMTIIVDEVIKAIMLATITIPSVGLVSTAPGNPVSGVLIGTGVIT